VDRILTPQWAIELPGADPLARFAAEELRRTLQRIGAPALPVLVQAPGPRIALRHGAAGDGFMRAADQRGITLRGEGPRGLLYAVYDLLEALGCSWAAPGPAGERLPRHERVALPAAGRADRPAIPRRSLIIGHDHFLAEAAPWVDWAARSRLNTIFIHTIGHGPALGACRLASWRAARAALLPRIRARGLDLELGGHHLSDLVPRRLFRSQPDLFRHNGARRTPDRNFCPSHPAAQSMLRANGRAFFLAHPEAQVYHLWPDDLLGGGWCACPRCAGLAPADQALLAANTLAAALAELRPDARVSYLAYHDTEAAPARIPPHPQVELIFAPRPRSYARGLGDPADPLNPAYAARLAENIASFPPGRAAVFEYYLDGILFKSAPPPLPSVLAADMAHYQAAGVAAVHALMTGDRPWRAAPINAFLFARLAWAPSQRPDDLLAAYAAARAPRAPAALARAYAALERAWRPALDRTPAEAAQRRDLPRARDLLAAPPLDVLDYMAAPRPHSERRLELLRAAEDQLAIGAAAWDEVMATAFADGPTLASERAEWDLGAALLRFLTLRQQLYVLAERGAPRPTLRSILQAAQAALDDLHGWAARYVPPQALAGHRLMRAIFQLHLDSIAVRRLDPLWRRLGRRARRFVGLAWGYLRVR
jgi:hypothetical protein